MKILFFSLCLVLSPLFSTVGAQAHGPCGKVHVPGHYGPHHTWVAAHYRYRRWVPAHRGPHGRLVPGYCE